MDKWEECDLYYAEAKSAVTIGIVKKPGVPGRFVINDICVGNEEWCCFVIYKEYEGVDPRPVIETVGVKRTKEECLDQILVWFGLPIGNKEVRSE